MVSGRISSSFVVRRYVEAVGGSLELVTKFPNRPPVSKTLDIFGEKGIFVGTSRHAGI